jgi:dihydroxyacetone kinase-like protein
MNVITASDLINLFDSWKQLFAEQREFLIALDGKVGDSDLGITMSKAFAAASEAVHAEGEAAGIAKLLRTAGATMARVVPHSGVPIVMVLLSAARQRLATRRFSMCLIQSL